MQRHGFSQWKDNKFDKTKLSTLLKAFKTKPNKGLKGIDILTRGNIYVFRTFETPKSSLLKQLGIKILGTHSIFQRLQIDKQKTHMYLKLRNYQECGIS